MSVKIRLRRMGKKKQPHYRIVVTDSRAPRDGRFVENLGYYNPVPDPATLSVDLSRVDYWVGRGAIVSPTVRSLVSKARAGGDERSRWRVPPPRPARIRKPLPPPRTGRPPRPRNPPPEEDTAPATAEAEPGDETDPAAPAEPEAADPDPEPEAAEPDPESGAA